MLRYVFAFFTVALIAGVLGFTELAGEPNEVARFLFSIFVGLTMIALLVHSLRNLR